MIELRNITKRFGAVLANDAVSIKVEPGTIHAIVGENGAGKSTAMRVVYGFYTADSGEILVTPPEATKVSNTRGTVGGWLLLFCLILTIINPLLTIYNLFSAYSAAAFARQVPGLGKLVVIDTVLSLALAAFSVVAGVLLWMRNPRAVKVAKTFLGFVMVYAFVALFFPLMLSDSPEVMSAATTSALVLIIRSTIFVTIWGLYLGSSKRVQSIFQAERPTEIKTPHDAIALGIGMVHQHFMLVEPMTVAENIVLGAEPGNAASLDLKKAAADIRRVSDEFRLAVDPNATIESLSVGQQQRVELLKALYRQAQLLILDEPTAVLTPQEVEEFFAILRSMREQGKTIVIITHKLDEVLAISDNVTVMRDGKVVGNVKTRETNAAELARMMVGREVLLRVEKPDAKPAGAVVDVRGLSIVGRDGTKRLNNVSLEIRAGEIVGIAGVEGNGQTELIEALAGLIPGSHITGTTNFEGRDITRTDARRRKELGIAHVPEDRHRRGLLLDSSLGENTILGVHYRKPAVMGPGAIILNERGIQRRTEQVIRDFDVRPPNPALHARALSGGNQQKLIIGREFELPPKLLLVSQPTRGVDIGAIEFIHRKIVELRDSGCAMLLVSAELEEVTALSDRLLVLHEGKIVGEVDPKVATNEEIGLMMTGGHK